jgi:hypothetical protein
MLYEDIFIKYHKKEIANIKGQRKRINSLIESSNIAMEQ